MAGSSESSGSSQSTSQSFIPDYSETPILEAIANQAAGMSSQVYQWGMNQFNATQGNIDNMMRDALSYASPQRISTDMGMAESGVQQGVEAARQSAITDLQSFGIDPSSGRYAALDEANRVMGAASAAGAGNQQRMADIAAGNAMRNQAISASEQNNMFGLGVGNSANGFLSTAMNLKYPPLGTVSQSSSSQQSSSQSTNPPTQPSQPKQSSQPSDKGADSGGGKGGGAGAGAGKGAAGMGAPPTVPGKVGSGLPGNQIPADVAAGTSGDPSTDPNSRFFDPYSARDPTGVYTGLPADVNTPNGPVAQWGLDPQTGYPLGNDINPGNQPFTGWPTVPGYGNGQPDLPSGAPQPPVAGWPGGGTAQTPAGSQDQGSTTVQAPDTSQAQGQPDPSQLPSMDPGALQDAGQPAPYTGLDQPAGTQTSGQGQSPPVDQTQNQYDPYAMDPTAGMIDSTGTPLDANGNQIIGQNDQGDGSGDPAGALFGTDPSGNWTVPVSDTGTAADTTAGFWSDIGQGAPDQPTTDFTLPPDAQGGITDPNSIWDQAAQDAGNFNTGFGGGDYGGAQGGQYGSGNYGGNYIGQGGNYSGGSNYAGGSNYSGNYGGNYTGQGGNYSGGSNYAGGSNYSGNYGGNYTGQGGNYSGGSNYAGGSNYSGNYGGNYTGQGGNYSGGSNYAGGSNYSGNYGGSYTGQGGNYSGGSNYAGGSNYSSNYSGGDNSSGDNSSGGSNYSGGGNYTPSASDSGGGGGYARGGPVRMQGRRNMPMRTGFRSMPRMRAGGPMPPGRMDPPPTPPPGVRPRPPAARHRAAPGGPMPGNFISPNGMTPPATGGTPVGRPTRPPPGIQQPRRTQRPQGFAGGGQVADPTTGGFVSKNLSPSNGGKTDDVNAKLNAGEFVIPKDVAAWEGKKFFYNLIAKARKMRAAGQKPEQAKMGYAAGGSFKPPQMPGMGGMGGMPGGNQPPPMQGAIGQQAPPMPRPQPPTANQVGRPSPLPNFQTMRQQSSRPQ